MNNKPHRGPHHSDDTYGEDVILIEFVAEMVTHDSPEFQEHARQAAQRAIPKHLQSPPKPNENPPAAT